jgi:hypothetical protein
MATLEEVDAELARRARLKEVDAELARRKQAAPAGPTFRQPEAQPYPDVAAPGTSVGLARQKVESGAFKLTQEQEAEAIKKAEAEARRKEGALVSPGGRVDIPRLPEEEPGYFERALDFVPEALQTAYEFYKPEAQEDIREVFQRQPVMTPEAVKEAEARVKAAGEEPLAEYLPDALRLSVKGVETPLAATLRGLTAPFTGAVELAAREALTYEVDPTTGQPRDPDDLSYLAEQALRGVLGDENYPATLSSGGVLGGGVPGKALDVPAKVNKKLRDAGVPQSLAGFLAEGITVPTFGPIDYGEGAAPDVKALDPYGLRKADTRLDWSDQVVRNARVDRSMKDLYVDMPEVRKAYKDTYGSESAAFYGGILADMFVPDATMIAGPVAKGAKMAGKAADAGLTAVAATRLYGGKVAREALSAAPKLTGEAVNAEVAKIVAREALAPRAIIDAIDIEGDVGRALANLPAEVKNSASGKWMVRQIQAGLSPADAFAELRVAQNLADVQRVWDATVAAGKGVNEARQAALATARSALGQPNAYLPPRVVDALLNAPTAAEAARRIQPFVPSSSSLINLGSPGSGAAVRGTLNLADDTLEGVGYAEAVAKVAESVRKTLGELVPRDMVAVTSKVMVPRDLAPVLRRAVDRDLQGVLEVAGQGFRVPDASKARVIAALRRVYPDNIRSQFWDDTLGKIGKGTPLAPSDATRLTDALQTDAYLRLAPPAGRAGAERLANIGKEFDRATGTAFTRALAGNLASRVKGAFTGRAKGVPGAYAAMGKRIGQETFGIPKRVADEVRAAAAAGEADPFRRVGDDLADKADEVGMGDNFVEEAWDNALEPLYGPFKQVVKDLARKDAGLQALLKNPPSLNGLEEVDRAVVGVIGEGSVREVKDFGSALLSGLVEAEAWVTARRIALEVMQDTPGLAVTLSPGLRGFPQDQLPSLVSRALSDIMAQGTTRAVDPNWTPTLGAPEYQSVLDAVGDSLRAMGVNYLDGVQADQVAARVASGITPQGYEIPGVILLRPLELERILNPEGLKRLAEGVEVLRRTKDGKSLVDDLGSAATTAEAFSRSVAELLVGSDVVRAGTNLFSLPVALLAREGLSNALNLTAKVVLPRKDGLLFTAGGRPWTRTSVDAEAARLGVEASTRLSASRRGRLASDLAADIEQGVRGNPAYRGVELGTQVAESVGRIIPGVVDAAERRFRYLGFEEGLRRGMTPEGAAEFSRDLLFDFEPLALDGWKRVFTPIVTKAVEGAAAIRSLVERPQEAVRIMRAARARQDYNERTYGGDEPILEPVPGLRPLGPAAAAWLTGVMADAYYGKEELGLGSAAAALNPVKAAELALGDLQTYLEGDAGETPDEMLNVMLLASMADRAGGKAGSIAGWDALTERYGLTPTNVTKDGVLPEVLIPSVAPTRTGAPPRGGEPVPLAFKMSPEGRKQFKSDWARLNLVLLGTPPTILQAWNDTGSAPEVRVPPPSEPATELYRQAAQATGREAP